MARDVAHDWMWSEACEMLARVSGCTASCSDRGY